MQEPIKRIVFFAVLSIVSAWYSYYLYNNADTIVDKGINDWPSRLLRIPLDNKRQYVQRFRRQALWPLGLSILFFIVLIVNIMELINMFMRG